MSSIEPPEQTSQAVNNCGEVKTMPFKEDCQHQDSPKDGEKRGHIKQLIVSNILTDESEHCEMEMQLTGTVIGQEIKGGGLQSRDGKESIKDGDTDKLVQASEVVMKQENTEEGTRTAEQFVENEVLKEIITHVESVPADGDGDCKMESQVASTIIGHKPDEDAEQSLDEKEPIKLENTELVVQKGVNVENGAEKCNTRVSSSMESADTPPGCSDSSDVIIQSGEDRGVTAPDVLKYRGEESDTDSDSDSSSSSDSSDVPSISVAGKEKVLTTNDVCPEQHGYSSSEEIGALPMTVNRLKKLREDIRTSGEVFPDELPPIEDLTITVDETEELMLVGKVSGIVDILVIIQSERGIPALDEDTILFREDRKYLGKVFEVFGPVILPFYSVRFTSLADIKAAEIDIGINVYCAPKKQEFTHYVFVDQLVHLKGSDASWKDHREPPAKYMEYSDDEEEQRAKAKHRRERQAAAKENGTAPDEEGEGKPSKIARPRRRRQQTNGHGGTARSQNSSGADTGLNDNQPSHQGLYSPLAPGRFRDYNPDMSGHGSPPGQMRGPGPPNPWQSGPRGNSFSQRPPHHFNPSRGHRGRDNFNAPYFQGGPRHQGFSTPYEGGSPQNYSSNPRHSFGPNFAHSPHQRFSGPPQFGQGPRMGQPRGGHAHGFSGGPQAFNGPCSGHQSFAGPFLGQMDGGFMNHGQSPMQQQFTGADRMDFGPNSRNMMNNGPNRTINGPLNRTSVPPKKLPSSSPKPPVNSTPSMPLDTRFVKNTDVLNS